MPNPILIADTGETLIFGEWVPGHDPDTEAAKLMELANAVGNWTEPMIEARAAIIEDTRQHFASETDPWGKPWEELSETYHEQKLAEGFPDQILVRDDVLRPAATDESAYFVTEREILFRPGALPWYGPYHQSGLPDRKPPLPQRAFIGVSEECENEIEAIFVAWLNRTTDVIYPSNSGGLGGAYGLGYGSSKLGTFSVFKMLPTGQPLLRTPLGGYHFGRGTSGGY